mmetsp:Transcript_9586/g.16833  ORF Transcript_9586/g.16833 Transcript_9586/m.16833 type:complete len:421 (+) Transcript_9586:270-1532(+)|eukprot:CAMPEP_0184523712 /NCGR_PEP_ID=MMETSP0198_2-20121128/9055_1 /TAXON_ID=1112570 /ORGANISM="Thraustochytrium sp., Strain LLF1b" /LENGTH=420 /DNA_ID=CAMNT_0026914811 /DNA_START=279 /DNA_END=1541 /DNA_ORIENTATION=-
MAESPESWLISLKNEDGSQPGDDAASKRVVDKVSSAVGALGRVTKLEVPPLRVGTLEKLMTAGDLLNKVDMNVEQVVRKVERQFDELVKDKNFVGSSTLAVNGMAPAEFLEKFRWNGARYNVLRSVDELIRNIVTSTTKAEIELKESVSFLQEKKQRVQTLERQKEGNLMLGSLDEKVLPLISRADIHDSPYLRTIPVIVAKTKKKDFEKDYATIGHELVEYRESDDAPPKMGSPVVPGSLKEVVTDSEGYTCFLITILKKFHEQFKAATQQAAAQYLVREYDFTEKLDEFNQMRENGQEEDLGAAAKSEEEDARYQLREWCKTNFSDVYSAWVHIKVIRIFVESVLRYGLPVNFTALVVKPFKRSNEKKIREKLNAKWIQDMDTSGFMTQGDEDKGALGEEIFPYVSFTIVTDNKDHHK